MARASNLVIGTATLAVIAVAFGGVLGVQKWRTLQSRSQLRVVFEGGSASGLRRGGPVNFDGVPAGQILSIKLDNPRKVVALVMLDNSAPIRKDTVAGIEFQGLTGVAAVSLIGGAPSAPPVPLDSDGIPVLTADLSDAESIVDTLHSVDRTIVSNAPAIRKACARSRPTPPISGARAAKSIPSWPRSIAPSRASTRRSQRSKA